jgi:hypothetical protein
MNAVPTGWQPSGQHLFLYCASPVPKEDEETTVSQLFPVGEGKTGEDGQGAIRPSLPAFNLRIVHELSRMLVVRHHLIFGWDPPPTPSETGLESRPTRKLGGDAPLE